MTVHYRIIFLLAGIFVLYTLLFSGFIYYSISNYAFTDFYKRLEIRAASLAKVKLEKQTDVGVIREIQKDYLEKLPNQKEYILLIQNEDVRYQPIYKQVDKEFVANIISQNIANYSKKNKFYSGIRYHASSGNDYVVIVGAENYFYTHHITYLQKLIVTSLIYAILLVLLIALFISRTLTKPINRIITNVEKISTENLHLRLKLPHKNDALQRLTLTFNDMLNRLETSFETQKNFISNASHELNTPLTAIIGEADLALSKTRSPKEYQDSLQKILEESERLNKKIKALLFLAQTGYDGKRQKFDKVRVDQLILDVVETIHKINNKVQVRIDFSLLPEMPQKLKIKGNEQLLHLALSNIIINGCKYSDNKPVSVALTASDKDVIIVIKDYGIGIPAQELQYIYDPFFRASNTSSYEGYGIGLPLSQNIIKMHGGKLQVNSQINEGTSVQINIPIGDYSF
jgi:signal transduction histidine kinase